MHADIKAVQRKEKEVLDMVDELRAQQEAALLAFAKKLQKQFKETAASLRAKCEQQVCPPALSEAHSRIPFSVYAALTSDSTPGFL